MSRGCLLLLPVVATIRSEISEPREVGISSPASSFERTKKERAKRKKEKRKTVDFRAVIPNTER
jgi:hypothetical protein